MHESFSVMPGLVPGIHVFVSTSKKDVDGRDKPGHDEPIESARFHRLHFEPDSHDLKS